MKIPHTILALDPASRCGWCVAVKRPRVLPARLVNGRDRVDILKSGVRELGSPTWPSIRVVGIKRLLDEIAETYPIREVVSELAIVHHGHLSSTIPIAELQGVIKLWCHLRRVPWRGLTPAQIKKHATGKGNAKKAQMVAAAKRKWGKVLDDNEADARWIAQAALA